MSEDQFKNAIKLKVEALLAVPPAWLSAPKAIRTLWPEIERFRRGGATYRRAMEIINSALGDRFDVVCMQVACSTVKRNIQS